MPALANISINDGKASPVAHVFSGTTTNGQKAVLHNRAASIARGWETLTVEVVPAGSPTAAIRTIGSITFPVLATVNGVETVVRTSKYDFVLNESQDMTEAEKKDHRVMFANLFTNGIMTTVIEKSEPIW